jgi:hypothetical protein
VNADLKMSPIVLPEFLDGCCCGGSGGSESLGWILPSGGIGDVPGGGGGGVPGSEELIDISLDIASLLRPVPCGDLGLFDIPLALFGLFDLEPLPPESGSFLMGLSGGGAGVPGGDELIDIASLLVPVPCGDLEFPAFRLVSFSGFVLGLLDLLLALFGLFDLEILPLETVRSDARDDVDLLRAPLLPPSPVMSTIFDLGGSGFVCLFPLEPVGLGRPSEGGEGAGERVFRGF